MTDHWSRDVRCCDVAGRVREVRVFIDDDHSVGLFTPPGDVARLRPEDLQSLQQALVNASIEATHRRAGHVRD